MRGQVTSRAAGAVAEGRNVRIGPASLFTLVIIVCLSVLAVLGASTAHAAWAMSQRMGTATSEFYQNEAGRPPTPPTPCKRPCPAYATRRERPRAARWKLPHLLTGGG